MQVAKKHITEIVNNYIRLYPDDFQTVKEGIAMQRGLHLDEFARSKGSDMRGLYEIPQELHEMLIMGLEPEEMNWLKAGGTDRKEGGRWFARTFKAFALPHNV